MKQIGCGLVGILLATAPGCNGSIPEGKRITGAETLVLRLPGTLKRPAVEFDHTKHVKAMEREGCKGCHPGDPQKGLTYKLWEGNESISPGALTDLYHAKCMKCHKDRTGKGKTGPMACGGCHVRRTPAVSGRRDVTFNYALHDAHVQATQKKCRTCHNAYDEAKKKFIYTVGLRGGAGDFHGSENKQKKTALRLVAHKTCVKCHLKLKDEKKKAGPVQCRGCHEAKEYHPDVDPTKLERLICGQPDLVYIKAPGAKTKLVPFDHKSHETSARFCSTCHHQTVKACKDCHTLTGSANGNGVTMEKAYHTVTSNHSCVGCHKQATEQRDCAGCHSRTEPLPGRASCAVCHRGPLPKKDGAPGSQSASMPVISSEVTLAPLPAASDDFPEKVVIKSLAQKYGPSELPHRKIVEYLDARIRKSKLAKRFHGRTEMLCAACHHRSPVGSRPPSCKSCHGAKAHPTKDKPSLKAAYHRQCIGCHQQMGLKKARGCTDCHKKAAKEVTK